MFARVKKSGPYQYLQIVENKKVKGKVKQSVITTLGRLDKLQEKARVDTLIASLSRFSEQTLLLLSGKSEVSADLVPMISDNWASHFSWRGQGPMPVEERARAEDIVRRSHQKGRLVRFWGTLDRPSPERTALWDVLRSAEVDLINTDDLCGLQQYLLARLSK